MVLKAPQLEEVWPKFLQRKLSSQVLDLHGSHFEPVYKVSQAGESAHAYNVIDAKAISSEHLLLPVEPIPASDMSIQITFTFYHHPSHLQS